MICDSHVRPATLVRVCDECNYGSYAGRCVVCGGIGVADAYYCKECTILEKDVSFGGSGVFWGEWEGFQCEIWDLCARMLTFFLP